MNSTMKKKYFCTAFAAALLFAGFAFTACDDDDDNSAPGTKPTIKFENVIPTKNYVQSGTFAAVAPGQTTSFTFHAAKGQRLMFATMYSNSNDLFFAPENPGIQLFNDSGVPYTGIIADAVKLWDNGTRVNEQPGPDVNHPGVAQAGVVTEVKGTDSEGHNYLAASSLLQVSLTFDAAQSLFTCTISNISAGTANETPFSGGVFVVSNLLDGDLVMDKPFFSVDQKSGVELTKLAEAGNVDPLKSLVADQTGIITTLHGAIVVVYTGNTNPIYQLGQKDAQLGLAALAQRGDPSQLKASLEKVPQVRKIYTLTDTVLPGKSMECTYEAAANEKVAFATMFGYSNDWFFANGPELNALTKGNVDPLKSLVADQTGIITTLHGAIVVVYTGNTNPIYQLGQKDAQLGLAALAQRGDPSQLKASLEKVPQVRKIYTLTDTVLPGKSMECTYEAAANEKVAFATMFGYSNDWFFANGPELNALTKGEVTNKTVLLDDGTAVSQYPGAGNAQFVFGGTRMPEDKAISAVGDTFPVPAVDGIVKITIY